MFDKTRPLDNLPAAVAAARALIASCECSLRRVLSNGERRDLLADNTRWSTPDIRVVVNAITR